MGAEVRWFIFILLLNVYLIFASTPHKKFEYKYSFKPPYLAQKDGSVPFWTYGGNAIASSESVRLAPSMRSQKGAMWTKSKTKFDWWEVDILFRITGRGRIGADGLAFWYTENQGAYDGQVFGSSDKWKGLGIFFDSFDNDNKHNNPYIMAVVNDGTREFDHQNDGGAQTLNGCLRDFRNKPFPTRARIEYYMNTLTVLFHNGMTNNEQDFEMCFRIGDVFLPKNGFFGLSAATGGLADDHDVLHVLTSSLYPPGQTPQGPDYQARVSPEEETKLSQEYAEYQRKLEHQKEEYKKEHPGTKDQEGEFDEWYESDSQRELRQIFSGQSQIYEQVKLLSTKLDEVIGRQERTLSLVQPAASQPGVTGGGGPAVVDPLLRHDMASALSNQKFLIESMKELSVLMREVNLGVQRQLEKEQGGRGQVEAVGGGSYEGLAHMNEIRDSLKRLKRDTEVAAERLSSQPVCASQCVSPIVLVLVALVQLVVMFVYLLYRDGKEQQYKKFY